jgi:death-on-curing protein
VAVQYLTFEEVVQLHDLLCFLYGGTAEIHDRGMIESALAQPETAVFGTVPYPTLWDKAAAYCYHLCLNHGFQDGNKRTAVGAAFHFLRNNGIRPNCSPEAIYEAVIRILEHKCPVEELAAILEGRATCPPPSS